MAETATAAESWREKHGLNHQQARFVRLIWGAKPATTAYMTAYGWPPAAVDSRKYNAAAASASGLLRNPKVKKALNALQEREASIAGLTRETKRGILASIAMGEVEGAKPSDMIRAVMIDNLMTGDNKPIKVEGELTFQAMLDSLPEEILPGSYAQEQTETKP